MKNQKLINHVCGAQGFNPMLGDVCEACELESPIKIDDLAKEKFEQESTNKNIKMGVGGGGLEKSHQKEKNFSDEQLRLLWAGKKVTCDRDCECHTECPVADEYIKSIENDKFYDKRRSN